MFKSSMLAPDSMNVDCLLDVAWTCMEVEKREGLLQTHLLSTLAVM